MISKLYVAVSMAKTLLKIHQSPIHSRIMVRYGFATMPADEYNLQRLEERLKEVLNKNGPESQQFNHILCEIESRLDQCVMENRKDEAANIHKLKASIVEEFFGKSSKKYINELRNLAYFYQSSEYYNEAIETLQKVKDNMHNTEESQSRWSQLTINFNQGICYSELGLYELAKNHFLVAYQMLQEINEESYHRNISEGSLYAEMGIAYFRLGQAQIGISKLQKAIKIFIKENKQSIYPADEETFAKPFIYLAQFKLEKGEIEDVERLVLEGMSYLKADIINYSKASLSLKGAHILLKIGKFFEANQLYNKIAAKVPLILKPNIIINKIAANNKQEDPDYELCQKETEKLGEIFKNLKQIREMKRHI